MSKLTFRGETIANGQTVSAENKAFVRYMPEGEMVFPISRSMRPSSILVKKGDPVLAGQVLAKEEGDVTVCTISSCSGTVKAVESRQNANGFSVRAIVVENDGAYNAVEGIGEKVDYSGFSAEEIIEKVKNAGLETESVPTYTRMLTDSPEAIHHVLVNGTVCDPFITCSDRLMCEYSDEIVKGMEILLKVFPEAEGVIVVGKDQNEAVSAMMKACSESAMKSRLSVACVKTGFLEGGERSIIAKVTDNYYKADQKASDVGCFTESVGNVRAIYRAVAFNEPLMEKAITVSGDGAAKPSDVLTRVGISYEELLNACGGMAEGREVVKLISGSRMKGASMARLNVPVEKEADAFILMTLDDVAENAAAPCIRCGRCSEVCPMGLNPQMMAEAADRKDYERYEKKLYGLECIGCGICTFECPAKRPLMQLFKMTKGEILLQAKSKEVE